MTWSAFALVFASVFLHAGWNLIAKKNSNSGIVFLLIMAATSTILFSPFLLFGSIARVGMPAEFYLFYLLSTFGEVLYMLGIYFAYSGSDISIAYPMIRSLPVLIIAGISTFLGIGTPPSAPGLAGMALLVAGCLLLPLGKFRDFRLSNYVNRSIGFILMAACGTTIYTLGDYMLMNILKTVAGPRYCAIDALSYIPLMEGGLFTGELITACCIARERRMLRNMLLQLGSTFNVKLKQKIDSGWKRVNLMPCVSGICSSLAYALVLFAMPMVTHISYLQAFRQMSLPLGFLAGIWFLGEKGTLSRYFGMFLIVCGLVMVKLG